MGECPQLFRTNYWICPKNLSGESGAQLHSVENLGLSARARIGRVPGVGVPGGAWCRGRLGLP